jgi:transposase-like protein
MGKPKRKFTEAVKRAAVDEYVSGRKSAAQVAAQYEISTGQVYSWRVQLDEKAKDAKLNDLISSERSPEEAAKMIFELERERDAYQKTVGEQTMIIELLKKRLRSTSSQQRSELTGLIETLERAVQKRGRGK